MSVKKQEGPLVTFALITYNQEQFVTDAINSALAQNYQPLEIIISDDCSTDRTYERVKSAVAGDQGQHSIRVRQTSKNLGTFAHVMDAIEGARGKLIVLAAGDDISKPERVKKLFVAWRDTEAWGLHSKFDGIDTNGKLISEGHLSEGLLRPEYRLRQYFYADDGPVHIVHGVGSAYDARIFEFLKDYSNEFILAEDGVLSFALNLLGKKIHLVDESLVCYRQHHGSLTNAGKKGRNSTVEAIARSEQKNILYALSSLNRTNLFLELTDSFKGLQQRRVNKEAIFQDNKNCYQKAHWTESGFADRARFLLSCRRVSDFKWIVPRLFGEGPFYLIKYLFSSLVGMRHLLLKQSNC